MACHEVYDKFVEPIRSDLDRYVQHSPTYSSQLYKPRNDKLAIDRFFGTNLADFNQNRIGYTEVGIPFGPGGLFSGATKTSTAARGVLRSSLEGQGAAASIPNISLNHFPKSVQNVNSAQSLKTKFSGLQKAQRTAARTRSLPDGRFRYYSLEVPASKQGLTKGASYVTEWVPSSGKVRSWMESYDHSSQVIRVHPKMLNGQILESIHYPPIGREMGVK